MTFKIDLSGLFQEITNDANSATVLFNKVNSYVQYAEQLGKAVGITGVQKLAAVKDMLVADLTQTSPALATLVSNAWTDVAGAISVTVSVFNAVSWDFAQIAPIIITAIPEAATAITAITSVIDAAKAVEATA